MRKRIFIPLKSGHELPLEVMAGLILNDLEPACISSPSEKEGMDRENKYNNLLEAMRLSGGDFYCMDRDVVLSEGAFQSLLDALPKHGFVFHWLAKNYKHGIYIVRADVLKKYPMSEAVKDFKICSTCLWMRYLDKNGVSVHRVGTMKELSLEDK